jgi:glucose-1-phosphate thymidylyltransferase
VRNSIVQDHSHIKDGNIAESMVGNYAHYHGHPADLSVGDYNVIA